MAAGRSDLYFAKDNKAFRQVISEATSRHEFPSLAFGPAANAIVLLTRVPEFTRRGGAVGEGLSYPDQDRVTLRQGIDPGLKV